MAATGRVPGRGDDPEPEPPLGLIGGVGLWKRTPRPRGAAQRTDGLIPLEGIRGPRTRSALNQTEHSS